MGEWERDRERKQTCLCPVGHATRKEETEGETSLLNGGKKKKKKKKKKKTEEIPNRARSHTQEGNRRRRG
jgi:hypothetical protein